MRGFIIHDLYKSTVFGTSNFLVAMGIFNYIEILGGFNYPAKYNEVEKIFKAQSNHLKFNFVYNDLFPDEYKFFREELGKLLKSEFKMKNTNKDDIKLMYDIFRCGFSHEYLMKTYNLVNPKEKIVFKVWGVAQNEHFEFYKGIVENNCGLFIEHKTNPKEVHIKIPRLIYDLDNAFEKYITLLDSDTESEKYRNKFIVRCKQVNFEIS